jgi:hypothetical protein
VRPPGITERALAWRLTLQAWLEMVSLASALVVAAL